MIRNAPVLYHLSKYNFSRCLEVVIRSGVVAMIEAVRAQSRGAGGRKPTGRRFTLTAILTVALAVFRVGRSPSSVEIYRGICTLNHDRLVFTVAYPTGGQVRSRIQRFQQASQPRVEGLVLPCRKRTGLLRVHPHCHKLIMVQCADAPVDLHARR